MSDLTIEDFKGRRPRYNIIACDADTGEVFTAVPEKAIADIASEFSISNEEALDMLIDRYDTDGPEVTCPGKGASFWMEEA